MNIKTDIKRTDIILVNWLLTLRSRGTYYYMAAIVAFILAFSFYKQGLPKELDVWGTVIVIALSSGILGVLVALTVNTLMIILASKESNGVLGEHHYNISPEGLFEKTRVNETLTKWAGILSVRHLHQFLLIQIAPGLFHIIPRRSFSNQTQYDVFTTQTLSLWQEDKEAIDSSSPRVSGR